MGPVLHTCAAVKMLFLFPYIIIEPEPTENTSSGIHRSFSPSQTPIQVSTFTKEFLAELIFVSTDTCDAQLLIEKDRNEKIINVNILFMVILTSGINKSNI